MYVIYRECNRHIQIEKIVLEELKIFENLDIKLDFTASFYRISMTRQQYKAFYVLHGLPP